MQCMLYHVIAIKVDKRKFRWLLHGNGFVTVTVRSHNVTTNVIGHKSQNIIHNALLVSREENTK